MNKRIGTIVFLLLTIVFIGVGAYATSILAGWTYAIVNAVAIGLIGVGLAWDEYKEKEEDKLNRSSFYLIALGLFVYFLGLMHYINATS